MRLSPLAKVDVEGSNPFSRSTDSAQLRGLRWAERGSKDRWRSLRVTGEVV